VLETLVNLASR